mgnify:CR=1 FL=1
MMEAVPGATPTGSPVVAFTVTMSVSSVVESIARLPSEPPTVTVESDGSTRCTTRTVRRIVGHGRLVALHDDNLRRADGAALDRKARPVLGPLVEAKLARLHAVLADGRQHVAGRVAQLDLKLGRAAARNLDGTRRAGASGAGPCG